MKKILVSQRNTIIRHGSAALAIEDGNLPSAYLKLTGINYDGAVYYDTGLYLHGSDTLSFAFKATKACNILGCYTTTDAQTNYSYYASTTSGAKYLRYNGGTYNSYIQTNKRYDITITPTGSSGGQVDSTWTEQTFTSDSTLMIGTTSYGATSAKLTGVMYGDIVILGDERIIPAERVSDGAIGYYMLERQVFLENLGTGTPTALGYAD